MDVSDFPPLPPANRMPDFDNLLAVLHRERPRRPTLYELFLNDRLYRRFARPDILAAADLDKPLDRYRVRISAYERAGYDYAHYDTPFAFPADPIHQANSISQNEGAVIHDRETFNACPWPDMERVDYSLLDPIAALLPPKMKLVANCPSGVLENAVRLVGYEALCLLIHDDPDLTSDVFAQVGKRLVANARTLVAHPAIGALMCNDDWGHRTQTMISPAAMRQYVFPWHQQMIEAAHRHGKPALLHSCGNPAQIMEDIIGIGFDARHSYEDNISPVEDFYDAWHKRIAVLGGIDVDFLCRQPLEAVTARSKAMLARAAADGAYALGTGNSVAPYIDDDRYCAMTRAALEG